MESVNNGHERIIQQTHQWVMEVVIGCHFCPFALPVVKQKAIRYTVSDTLGAAGALEKMMEEIHLLDREPDIETTLIIFPKAFQTFPAYLNLVEMAEQLLEEYDYEGVYQIASFHPQYKFADSSADDPANYTNRSLYPMLHLLREEALAHALDTFPEPESIPMKNIEYCRNKGIQYMKGLRDKCFEV